MTAAPNGPEDHVEEHISTLLLHQYRYGELDAPAMRRVDAHLQQCPACSQRHQHQLATRAEFEVSPVPQALLDAIAEDAPRPSLLESWRRWLWLAAAPMAVAALALVFVQPGTDPERPLDPQIRETVRMKGALPALEAWRGDADGSAAVLTARDAVRAGDVIQLMVDPHGASWAALAGRDGTGELQIFGAFDVSGQQGLVRAPFSLTLDDAPGPQVFYVVTSEDKPSEAHIRAALDGGNNSDVQVVSLELSKE